MDGKRVIKARLTARGCKISRYCPAWPDLTSAVFYVVNKYLRFQPFCSLCVVITPEAPIIYMSVQEINVFFKRYNKIYKLIDVNTL